MSSESTSMTPAQVREILGDGFSHEMDSRVTENLGIDVLVLDIDGDAYTMHLPEGDVIVVRRTTSWFRQNFSLAHELGHIVSGHMHQADRGDEEEKIANSFAADLLMPADVIRGVDWQTPDLATVAQLVWDLGVSSAAVATRLTRLDITPCDEMADALTQKTCTLLRHHWAGRDAQPDPITHRRDAAATRKIPNALLSALGNAVDAGRAPAESLAWAMDVPVEDLELPDHDHEPDEAAMSELLSELP